MRRPGLGEANLGALAATVIGAIGGLFALGIPRAMIGRNPALLFELPSLGLISLVLCGSLGWLLGGQLGPRLGERFRSQKVEILGGILGGLIPVLLTIAWGWWYMTTR